MAMSRSLKRSQPQPSQEDVPRILKKRTLILGEVDSSSSEDEAATARVAPSKNQESFGEKLDRLFPGWWEQDQHKPECSCLQGSPA